MTTPNPQPPTSPANPPAAAAAEADPGAVDQALAERARTSADVLAGIIAASMLDTCGTPDKLPELLFPHIPPEHVRQVWQAALPVGYRAGQLTARPQWTTDGLDRLRAALYDAGYRGMGRLADRAAFAAPSRALPGAGVDAEPDDDTHGRVDDGADSTWAGEWWT